MNQTSQTKNLYVRVDTYNEEGREIGTRIVDMYHPGTNDWLQKHNWWAMHNNHTVESHCASKKEIDAYLEAAKQALQDKYQTA